MVCLGDDGSQTGVVGRIGDTAALLNSYDQLLCDLGKSGSTLGILRALGFLNVMPFGMSGHGNLPLVISKISDLF